MNDSATMDPDTVAQTEHRDGSPEFVRRHEKLMYLTPAMGALGRPALKDLNRFFEFVKKVPCKKRGLNKGMCWEWQGFKDEEGYGQFSYNGRKWKAYRFAALAEWGVLLAGKEVHHECTNPSCVNPEHLDSVSKLANLKEMNDRMRNHRKGYDNPSQGLLDMLVPVALPKRENGEPARNLKEYLGEFVRHPETTLEGEENRALPVIKKKKLVTKKASARMGSGEMELSYNGGKINSVSCLSQKGYLEVLKLYGNPPKLPAGEFKEGRFIPLATAKSEVARVEEWDAQEPVGGSSIHTPPASDNIPF